MTSPPVPVTASDGTEAEAERLVGSVTAAYDIVLPPRSSHSGGRSPVYWWNGSIAAAQTEYVQRKRSLTRARGRRLDGDRVCRGRVL